MGCVCSRRFPEDAPPAPGQLAAAYDARRGRYGPGDFDSGELAIPPPKPPHSHKVPSLPSVAGCPRCPLLPSPLPASLHACCRGSRCLIWCVHGGAVLLLCCKFWFGDTAAGYPDSIG